MASNTHVVFVRGLSPEEHRMLSALASNSKSRTVNGFMLEVIRELLGGRSVRALALPDRRSRIAEKIASWGIPGQEESPTSFDEPAGRPEPS